MRKAVVAVLVAVVVCSGWAQGSAANAVIFDTVFPSYGSEEEALAALKADPEGRDAALMAGNYYWMLGAAATTPAGPRRELCRKGAEILERYWRKHKRDDQICLCLGYAYAGLAGSIPLSELEDLMSAINKAQNVWGMAVARLPRNIELRLARTIINMNLTPQNGRPDALILEDVGIYFAGYSALSEELRKNAYYYMGAMEMRLAQALVLHGQNKRAEAAAALAAIDETVLSAPFLKLLAPLKKAYGR